ncbi:MAG: hypothetical protein HOB12_02380 [Gemmatimonadales bacterium]|nr:hypothetical protein [Gemmatimonadales bacterium]
MSTSIVMARADENSVLGALAGSGRGSPVLLLDTNAIRSSNTKVAGPRHFVLGPSSFAGRGVSSPGGWAFCSFAARFASAFACLAAALAAVLATFGSGSESAAWPPEGSPCAGDWLAAAGVA